MSCQHCPHPQVIGGDCKIVNTEMVHYFNKKSWVVLSKTETKTHCHEDFMSSLY